MIQAKQQLSEVLKRIEEHLIAQIKMNYKGEEQE
jgi:hypothetical protein